MTTRVPLRVFEKRKTEVSRKLLILLGNNYKKSLGGIIGKLSMQCFYEVIDTFIKIKRRNSGQKKVRDDD